MWWQALERPMDKRLNIVTLKLKTGDFAKIGCNANQNAWAHTCLLQSKKGVILKAVKWTDNSFQWSEQLMQIPPSSWITFGTRQMVHPQNQDCTNFTEWRFSQDSEHKWIDGRIATYNSHCVLQAALSLVYHGAQCASSLVPSIPLGIELKGKLFEYELLRLAPSLCCRRNLW